MSEILFEDTLKKASLNAIFGSYGIELEILSNGGIYSGSGITAEEIAIFEVSDQKDVPKIKKAIEKYIEGKRNAYEGYVPKELLKLKNPVVVTNGRVVVLCISNNNAVAEKTIKEFLE